MQRREFITLLGGAAASWPVAARAQQPSKLPTIGFLGAGTASAYSKLVGAFAQRLHEHGWTVGSTVAIEYRWAEGRKERMADIAAEFVHRKVDVIVTHGTVAIAAAKRATSIIPIVFALANDPLGDGFVTNLSRPGGNITGMSLQESDTAGKRLELLRGVVPNLRRLAIMVNIDSRSNMLELAEVQSAARTLGLDVSALEVRRAEEIAPALVGIQGHTDALYVAGDPLLFVHRVDINTFAVSAKLPTMFNCQRRLKDASVFRSKNTSMILSRRPPNWGPFRQASGLVGIIRRQVRTGTA